MGRDPQTQFDEGIKLFNRCDFFDCHEVLEEVWTPTGQPERWFLQSLIHFAVGFYHHQRGNRIGATRQLDKGLKKIQRYLPEWGGVRTAEIEREVRGCLAVIEGGGVIEKFPQVGQYGRYEVAPTPSIVWLPGGEFQMGRAGGLAVEQPVHLVRVAPFGLGLTQVTNAQYDRFVAETSRKPSKFRQEESLCRPEQPVVGPSWFDAVAYCEWLSLSTGKHYRLPREAEWEWAARGGLANCLYPWGDTDVTERRDYASKWREGPEPAGVSQPNGYGLYEMCENVHEWCADWYGRDYYSASPADNPRGPVTGTRRASRGGSWRHHVKISRCAARSSIPPEFEYADYGFRVACESGR
jgi:formylglycine-generating enzyme required for sulfatase activity